MKYKMFINPNLRGILARNFPESSKILQYTFGNMPLSSKCTMHFRWSFIFSTYGLYFLPGSNFGPFEDVKVPVLIFSPQKSAPWKIFGEKKPRKYIFNLFLSYGHFVLECASEEV